MLTVSMTGFWSQTDSRSRPLHSLRDYEPAMSRMNMEKLDSLKRLQAETTAELDALLPAILDRAFKGEL